MGQLCDEAGQRFGPEMFLYSGGEANPYMGPLSVPSTNRFGSEPRPEFQFRIGYILPWRCKSIRQGGTVVQP